MIAAMEKRPMLEQFVENCSPWDGLRLKFMGSCLPCEGSHTGAGGGLISLSSDELTTTPIPATGAEEEELGKREGWGEGVFASHYPAPFKWTWTIQDGQ